MNTDQFIKAARRVHGDRYDYSQADYLGASKKLSIICQNHGPFSQKASAHLKGAGCKLCADREKGEKKRREAAATFDTRARAVHSDRYDYSQVKYKNSGEKVKVICSEHGPFFIRPNNHIRGVGCPNCGTEAGAEKQRMSGEEFLIRAKRIHGDRYDYSRVKYRSYHRHVEIICPLHGVFQQAPAGHLAGRGCVWCAAKINADRLRLGTDEFVNRARQVHGDNYDYSKVEYISNLVPVSILCKKHGAFSQAPSKHIDAKQGCPSCANRDMNLEKFVERSRAIHGEKYDYSRAVYLGARRKIAIICPKHGEFDQVAHNHMVGIGCAKCVDSLNSRGSQSIEAWVQNNQISYEREKVFDDLKSSHNSRYKLRWDFFLPDLRALIEFDGQQHFQPNALWGGVRAFKRLQANDAQKNEWALKNNYHLVRIRFDQVEEIETILNYELGSLLKD